MKKILKGIEYIFYGIVLIFASMAIISIVQNGLFESINSLQTLIADTGIWGQIIFILFQIVQVIIPIIPGGLINGLGVILYGPWQGFFLNLIGNFSGSLIAFLLGRRFGIKIINFFFEEDLIKRYQDKLEEMDYIPVFLTIAVALPGVPDGLLIYLTGIVTKLSLIKFIIIMVIGRGTSLLVYSVGIDSMLHFIENLLV